MPLRTWSLSQNLQMLFRYTHHGIPGHDHWTRTCSYGPYKTSAISTWKPPTSVKGVHSFLGFANFYQKFIPNYSNIVTPLTALTKKDQPWTWSSPQQQAFDTLHNIFASAPVLSIPDVSWPFHLMSDASLLAAGIVLMQKDINGDLHPCAYFSKTFSVAEWNYDIYDRELLAVILALSKWKHYLQGTSHPVSIITDHKNLSYIKDPRKLSRRQACWSLFLQDFHIEWIVTPGSQMGPADALSHKDDIDTSSDNHASSIVLTLLSSMLLTSPSSNPSHNPPPLIHWSFESYLPYKMDPHCFLASPFLIGILTTAISISKIICMFLPPLAPPSSIPCIPLPPLATWIFSTQRPSSNAISGGWA